MSKVKRYLCDLAGTTDTVPMEVIKGQYVVLASDYDALQQRCREVEQESHKNRVDLVGQVERCDALRAELTDLRNSMAFRTGLIGRTEQERDALRAEVEALRSLLHAVRASLNPLDGNWEDALASMIDNAMEAAQCSRTTGATPEA